MKRRHLGRCESNHLVSRDMYGMFNGVRSKFCAGLTAPNGQICQCGFVVALILLVCGKVVQAQAPIRQPNQPNVVAIIERSSNTGPTDKTGNVGELGSKATDFSLPDLSGNNIRLDATRGKTVLLNFWAFWCDTWKAEMPELRELAGRRDDLGFQIICVSVDGSRLPEFQHEKTAPFPVLLDLNSRVTEQYSVDHVPTVLLIDPAGIVRFRCVAWPGNQVILNHLRALASKKVVPDNDLPEAARSKNRAKPRKGIRR